MEKNLPNTGGGQVILLRCILRASDHSAAFSAPMKTSLPSVRVVCVFRIHDNELQKITKNSPLGSRIRSCVWEDMAEKQKMGSPASSIAKPTREPDG